MLHRTTSPKMRHGRQFRQITACVLLSGLLFTVYHTGTISLHSMTIVRQEMAEEYREALSFQSRKPLSTSNLPIFDPRFRNPCFLDQYDFSISDAEYYSQNKLLKIMEQKYNDTFVSNLNRSALVDSKNSSVIRLRCLPYYYVLGSAKSGTTDLTGRLQCHHHVLRPVRKEPMWLNLYRFDSIRLDEYMDVFDLAANDIAQSYKRKYSILNIIFYQILGQDFPFIVGDHSSMTLSARKYYTKDQSDVRWPNSTAALVKMITPLARFIIILRHPTERVYSYYKMHYAKSPEHFHQGVMTAIQWWTNCIKTRGIDDHCLYHNHLYDEVTHTEWDFADALSAVRQSLYVYYVTEWLQYFSSSNFLILKSEEYYANVFDTVTKQVFSFLGLEATRRLDCIRTKEPHKVVSRLVRLGEREINLTYNEPMLDKTRRLMNDFYKPYNMELAQLLKDDKWLW